MTELSTQTDYRFRFTPAQWRHLLEDPDFLAAPDNSYQPRRLMGLPVEIVPDPNWGLAVSGLRARPALF